MDKKITIFDVAAKAGVSKGTVDRVLHNRGEVSKKSAEKVRRAIEELDYEPNFYASLLATRKNHVIACILPEIKPGEYWEKIRDGFLAGGTSVSHLNVETRLFTYDQYDPESFEKACRELIDSKPSGVVIAPLFKNGSMRLADELKSLEIPYIYVDTKLEESDYFAYFGMPMYKSGFLCASLMTERCTPDQVRDIAVIRIQRDKTRQSDPTINRRAGFTDFIDSNFPECRIHNVFIDPSKPETITPCLEKFFSEGPDFKFVVMFNSRVHLAADFLSKHPNPGRRVIGFDNIPANLEALRQSYVDILIAQHTESQSSLAVATLSDYILMHKRPPVRDNYMHMDILTPLNIENY